MKKNNTIVLILLLILTFSLNSATSYAYVLNGVTIPNPMAGKYYLSSTLAQNSTLFQNALLQWNDLNEIYIYADYTNPDISLYADYLVDNGTYGIASSRYNSGTWNTTIKFYNLFLNASTIVKEETVVHEVGHALGLGHCQAAKNTVSVMRETGFNYKAYPLSDDIQGISVLY